MAARELIDRSYGKMREIPDISAEVILSHLSTADLEMLLNALEGRQAEEESSDEADP